MKLFELFADLSLNSKGFSDGVKSAAKQGNNLASTLKDGIGGAATFVSQKVSATTIALGNLMADAVKATAGAAKDLVQNVFEEYANTEQLYGGVETIFKNSADLVKKNADEAFMTAGMSANEYMQTVTSFSSSLLQGLDGDTKKAAEVADMAIKDMSDNANKFGTDMGLIQNAYQGFAKDNFTMLDNLKLGYGGTQAEMARLINDSGVLGGKLVTAANVAEVPLDKMFEAIHKIQTEMDITGTTAAEAADTISGSFASFKASWRNLLSGLADEKEVDVLVDNLFETGENLITNLARLVPRIGKNTLEAFDAFLENFDVYNTLKNAYKTDGVAGVVEKLKEEIGDQLAKIGPIAIDTGADLIAGIYTGLKGDTTSKEQVKVFFSGLWEDVVATKDKVVTGAQGILGDIYVALTGDTTGKANIKGVFDSLWQDMSSAAEPVVSAASGLLASIYEGLTGQEATKQNIIDTISGLFSGGLADMETLKTNAAGLMSGIASAITGDETSITDIGEALGGMFAAGSEAVESLKSTAGGLLGSIYTTFTGQEATADNIGKTIGGVFNAGVTAAESVMTTATTFFSDLANNLGDNKTAAEKVAGVFEAGVTASKNLLSIAKEFGFDLYAALDESGAAAAEKEFDDNMDRFEAFGQKVKETASKAWEGVKDFADTNLEPMFEDKAEDLMSSPVYDPISDFVTSVAESAKKIWNDLAAEGQKIKEATSAQWYMMKYSPEEIEAAVEAIKKSPGNGEEAIITKEAQVEDFGAPIDSIIDAWRDAQEEIDRGGGRRFGEPTNDVEESEDSALPEVAAALQTVAESLSTLKADVTAAAKEGCMAGVGSITVTGSVSTGNVMLNTGALVGSLAPKLNLKLGVLNARG